jgi:hypothetical protein
MCLTLFSLLLSVLSASAGLARLSLIGGADLDEVCAVAIGCWLRQLRSLQLVSCRLGSAAIAAIGSLTQLTCLVLQGCSNMVTRPLEDHDILLLSALTQLQELDFVGTFSGKAVAMHMRHLRRVHGVEEPSDDAADDEDQEELTA